MRKRILTGDNTTGRLHLGHYVGSLKNRIKLQEEYETFIVLADLHALAYPKYIKNPQIVGESTLQVALDNMAVGIDPEKVTYFPDSAIPEIAELALILSMTVSHNRALRNPTLKEEIKDKGLGDNFSLGFINFPVLMAADILCVNAHLVPVGEDQLPHLELTRELARKFNRDYGEVFVEPEGLVGDVARLIGTDGNAKMSKSIGNTIMLSDNSETVKKKIMSMYTDPNRLKATDQGTVEENPVFIYHDAFNPNKEEIAELKDRYTKGTVGDVEVKEKLFVAVDGFLAPIREKRIELEKDVDYVNDVLSSGIKKTREVAAETLDKVKSHLHLF